jgi:hypothetical protein
MKRQAIFIQQLVNQNNALKMQCIQLLQKNSETEKQNIELQQKLTDKDNQFREVMEKYDIYPKYLYNFKKQYST